MRAFASEIQRSGILRDTSPRPRARRLLKGGKYVTLKKQPKRGQGPAGASRTKALQNRWEKKKFRKTKPWPSKGIGGYVADFDEETDDIRDKAKSLQQSTFLMHEHLGKPSFREACGACGILPSDLEHKPLEDFQKVENRAFDRTFSEQHAAYTDNEAYRAKLIRKVLLAELRLKEEYEKREALEAKEQKQMAHLLQESMKNEQKRIERMAKTSNKIERAKKFQHAMALKEQRARQEALVKRQEHSVIALQRTKKSLEVHIKKASKELNRRLRTSQARREQISAGFDEQREQLRKQRSARMAEIDAKMAKRKEDLLASKKAVQNLAAQRKERDQERQDELRRVQEEKLAKKEQLLQDIRDKQEAQRKMRIFKASLTFERRRKQAERLQLAHQRRVASLERDLRIKDKRAHALKEIRSAVAVERHSIMREAKISLDEWKATNYLDPRSLEPGPGDYDLPDVFHPPNPALSLSSGWKKGPKPPTEFDKRVAYAATLPAPGDYGAIDDKHNSAFGRLQGGEWGDYKKPKNEFELAMDKANDTPAAQDYDPTPLKSNVGSVNMNGEKPLDTQLDIIVRRAKDMPGPDTYSPPLSPKSHRSLKDLKKQLGVSTRVLGFIGALKRRRATRTEKEPPLVDQQPTMLIER